MAAGNRYWLVTTSRPSAIRFMGMARRDFPSTRRGFPWLASGIVLALAERWSQIHPATRGPGPDRPRLLEGDRTTLSTTTLMNLTLIFI